MLKKDPKEKQGLRRNAGGTMIRDLALLLGATGIFCGGIVLLKVFVVDDDIPQEPEVAAGVQAEAEDSPEEIPEEITPVVEIGEISAEPASIESDKKAEPDGNKNSAVSGNTTGAKEPSGGRERISESENAATATDKGRDTAEQKKADHSTAGRSATAAVMAVTKPPVVSSETAAKAVSPAILSEYRAFYDQNKDLAGWLTVPDTPISYPVMQNRENEAFYFQRDFHKEFSANGSLYLDSASQTGEGSRAAGYTAGKEPSSVLIIHGNHMQNGSMFGTLTRYADAAYAKEHSRICFDTLYEKREYEVMAAFYTQEYSQETTVFRYNGDHDFSTAEEFLVFYYNVKGMSLYDTAVVADYGDEFLVLSTDSSHTVNGRFVVVGKRIR